MVKKKRTSKRKSSSPEHKLPAGFWAQAGAIFLIALSILLVVSWFDAGGPILNSISSSILKIIGDVMYILPILFVYLAIEIFRAENNKVAVIFKIAIGLLVLWLAGLFDILKDSSLALSGGASGQTINYLTLALVSNGVAIFIYSLLVLVTLFYLGRVTPKAIFSTVWGTLRSDLSEAESNMKVFKKVSAETGDSGLTLRQDPITNLKLNEGVPTTNHSFEESQKPVTRLSSFKGATPYDRSADDKSALVAINDPNWQPPSLDLLEKKQSPADVGDIQMNAQTIRNTLADFSIDAKMEGVNVGPKVTQYTLSPPNGVKLTRITALENNLALDLAAPSIRIEAPIPGQKAVGIEVPNRKAADVRLFGILSSKQWKSARQPLTFAIGKDISGDAMVGELNKMPHLLIAGQTGSGKSVMINTLLTSLLYRNSPSEMRLILVDPKMVELAQYEDIPHLLTPVINEPEKTISALKWAVNEMERRYKLFKDEKVRDIASYNQKIKQSGKKIKIEDEDGFDQKTDDGAMPYVVIVIDELSDLMMTAPRDVEALIVRIAQKARAVGIHLVLATQRPSVNVITGLIKANIPARIAFTVTSQVDSRTILDEMGAEKLLGQGDMLIKTAEMSKPKRVQGAWVTDAEVVKIVDYLKMQSAPQYNDEIISQPVHINNKGGMVLGSGDSGDSKYQEAVRLVVEERKASTSYLQRRLKVGYARAAGLIDEMEENGIVGPADGSRPRDILVTSLDEIEDS